MELEPPEEPVWAWWECVLAGFIAVVGLTSFGALLYLFFMGRIPM